MDITLNHMHGQSLVVIGRALIELGEMQERERAAFLVPPQYAETPAAEQPQAAEPVTEDKPAKKPRAAKPAAPAPAPAAPEEAAPAAPEPAAEPAPAISLVDLRAKLAELSRDGKADRVKALLSEFGVAKLTELEPAKFAAVMTAAEAL